MSPFQGCVPSRPRPDHEPALLGGAVEVQYQGLAPGHILQLTVHVLQVCSQHLLGLQGILTFGLTLLQLDRNRSRRKSLLGHPLSLTAQPNPALTGYPTPSHLSVNTHPVNRGYLYLRQTPKGAYSPHKAVTTLLACLLWETQGVRMAGAASPNQGSGSAGLQTC